MEILIAIIIAGAVIAYVGYPLLQPLRRDEEGPEMDENRLIEVVTQKESALAAIAELDFDRAMGNLSELDYRELRDRYRHKALALLKQEDEMSQETATESAEILQESVVADAEPPKRRASRYCSYCGARVAAADGFCAACGNPFGGSGCPSCGAKINSGDAFCAKCGQKLVVKGRK